MKKIKVARVKVHMKILDLIHIFQIILLSILLMKF
jgi:hypothetical protein